MFNTARQVIKDTTNSINAAKALLRSLPAMRLPIDLQSICDTLRVEIRYTKAPVHSFGAYCVRFFPAPRSDLL